MHACAQHYKIFPLPSSSRSNNIIIGKKRFVSLRASKTSRRNRGCLTQTFMQLSTLASAQQANMQTEK